MITCRIRRRTPIARPGVSRLRPMPTRRRPCGIPVVRLLHGASSRVALTPCPTLSLRGASVNCPCRFARRRARRARRRSRLPSGIATVSKRSTRGLPTLLDEPRAAASYASRCTSDELERLARRRCPSRRGAALGGRSARAARRSGAIEQARSRRALPTSARPSRSSHACERRAVRVTGFCPQSRQARAKIGPWSSTETPGRCSVSTAGNGPTPRRR